MEEGQEICKEITKFGNYISSESPSRDESNESLCNLKIFCVTLSEDILSHVIGAAVVATAAAAILLDEIIKRNIIYKKNLKEQ